MNIDFIHVGYHRTATSMLQFFGFPLHSDIVMANDPRTDLDDYFVRNFVETDDFFSNRDDFIAEFPRKVKDTLKHADGKIIGISEENISGHFWNGMGSKILAERVKEMFGAVKIIIVVRNQYDMFESLYGNYVKNSGGMRSIDMLLRDDTILGHRIFSKLCYHHLIEHYRALFGADNVLVLCYESLKADFASTLNRIFSFVGARSIDLDNSRFGKKANRRLSRFGEALLRFGNRFDTHGRGIRRTVQLIDWPFKYLGCRNNEGFAPSVTPPQHVDAWRLSNHRLQRYISADLESFQYPM